MTVDVAPTTQDAPPGRAAGRWLPWLVIGLWVALAAVMVPLSGKLSSVTTDKAVDALPASAESTKVAVLEESLPGAEDNTFVFVYHRAGRLTYADRATVERHYDTLAKKYPPKTATGGEEDDDGPAIRPSTNGNAMMFALDLSTSYGPPEELVGPLRDAAKDRPTGLELEVTGPAAIDGDLDAVFDGIDLQVFLTTVIVVTILLILTYRSPVLWFVPLVVVGVAALTSMATVYLLVKGFGIVVDNQNSALLTILVFGVGTDYALLLIARYRETLHHYENVRVAMVHALRGAAPAIIASAATVVAGLLCLLAADLNSISGLGPIGAAGILCALVAMLTLFPAVLVVLGRRIFWPAIPRFSTAVQAKPGLWGRLGAAIDRRRWMATLGSFGILAVLCIGLTGNTGALREQDQFLSPPESVTGFTVLRQNFPELGGQPMTVYTRPAYEKQILDVVKRTPGVAQTEPGQTVQGWTDISVYPADAPDTPAEYDTIKRVRAAVHAVSGAEAIVGGPSAENLDTEVTTGRDEKLVIPLVLAVVLIVLGLLLRAIVAPLVLMATVIVSFAAAFGGSVFVFDTVLGFQGIDYAVPLLAFLFLVALGVDYNIFLTSRAREETARLGTRDGMRKALSATGGVITSAGLVLAATFAVLVSLPLVMLVEVGFLVAFGVLLDALLVRSVLVPALTLLIGRRIWWPSRLSRPAAQAPPAGRHSRAGDKEPARPR
ncbi:membrane protein [Paractinoplanes abujensis]|uniref:RND superfamily putative drug exporter n=1 Tax=Paractinoplanes abujensis TaxID=882441 RepID=A0A7W7CRG8_9ACTN|nr:MMPL family transporter [Actinoplanes abujensis]MBB4693375.1 RND superfamily putative drug exporter [Actinoplanes abujensis]GID24579.1 membrane protein [Actinoplanes abujensis]